MFRLVLVLFITLLSAGCHKNVSSTLREEEDEYTLPLTLQLDLSFNLTFNELESDDHRTIASLLTSYHRRYILEIRRGQKVIARHIIIDENPISEGRNYTLPLNVNLPPTEYELDIWSDYVYNNTASFYNCGNLDCISCIEPYVGNEPHRECLYGHTVIDLNGYGHHPQHPPELTIPITMHSPLAKYQILATDLQAFLQQHPNRERLWARFSYAYFYPMVFDATTGRVNDAWSGIAFTVPFIPEENTEKLCLIGYDYIFADPEENIVQLDLWLEDAQGREMSQPVPIAIPYKQGFITTIKGNFLTGGTQGGLQIHTEYDGEIDVDLDQIISNL